MRQYNSTFTGSEPFWANACVGENGSPGYWEYSKGFSQAAVILIDLVLRTRGIRYSVDELIYPVCFNMRHSVELRLKGSISELIQLESYRSRNLIFDFSGSHNINNIWEFFKESAKKIDSRYDQIIERLNIKINDIAEIDATGQTFRYPIDTESRKHLVNVSVINFLVLKRSFTELEATLDELHRLNTYLLEEYSWGSFTKKLSRRDLFEIATLLPHRTTWTDKSFDTTRDTIKEKFGIGSKELSDAIEKIKSHFELAPEIGVELPLLGVTKDDIYEFVFHWFKLHELESDKAPVDLDAGEYYLDTCFDEIKKRSAIKQDVWHAVGSKITPEILAGLSALFYFARDLDFSESYAHTYAIHLREAHGKFAASDNSSIRQDYFHIFEKSNAVYNILQSLYFLRQQEIADQLVATYELDSKFSWLDKARTRSLFRKPDYCGYVIKA